VCPSSGASQSGQRASEVRSDVPDSGAVSCVVRAFYGLRFPRPEGGIVTVMYPVMFSPGA